MIKLFKALGFRKSDEMDVSIQLKSIRISWAFGIICLAVWSLYESYIAHTNNVSVNLIPSALLISQSLILVLSQLILHKHMGKGGDEKNPATGQLFGVILIAIVILVLGSLLPLIMR